MPQIVPIVAYYAAAALAGSSLAASVAALAASAAVADRQRRRQNRAARDAFNASLRDQTVMSRGEIGPSPLVYGQTALSGPLVFATSTGNNKEFLWLVIGLAMHEFEEIGQLYINDSAVSLDGSGNVTTSPFAQTPQISTLEYFNVPGSPHQVTVANTPDGSNISVSLVTVDDNGRDVPGQITTDYSRSGATFTFGSALSGFRVAISYTYSGTTTYYANIKKYLGTSSQTADADLVAAAPSEWTSNHRGRNIAHLVVRLRYDQNVWTTGIPNIKAVVKGRKVYDPRSTLTAWSSNPALIARDYLLAAEGLASTSARVSDAAVIEAANVCDEDVQISAVPTSQDRYTFDGVLSTGDNRRSNLDAIAQAMAGAVNYSQGTWRPRAGAYSAPAITITEADLCGGGISIAPYRSRRDLINACKGTFLNPAKQWAEDAFPEWTSSTYQTEDGAKLGADLALPFVTDVIRAQRLAKIAVTRARESMTVTLPCNLRQYARQVGDMVNVTLSRYGFSAKPFRVVDRRFSLDEGVVLTLLEEPNGIYDWNFGEAVSLPTAGNTTLPQPWLVTAPTITNIVSSSEYSMAGQKKPLFYMLVTLGGTLDANTREIQVEYAYGLNDWQQVVAPPSQTTVRLPGVLEATTYRVRARAVNNLGAVSAWFNAIEYVIGDAWVKHAGADAIFTAVSDGAAGRSVARNVAPNANGAWYFGAERKPIDPADTYKIRGYYRKTTSGADGGVYIGVRLWDAAGANISGEGVEWINGTPGGGALGSTTSWQRHERLFGAGTSNTFPSNARTMAPVFIAGYSSTVGQHEVQDVGIDTVIDTTMISPNAATDIYLPTPVVAATCNWNQSVGGAHSGQYLYDATIASGLITMEAGQRLLINADVIGDASFGGAGTTRGFQSIGIDIVVQGSGKAQFHVDVTDRTGNLKVAESAEQADGKKSKSLQHEYTAPSNQVVQVYAGAGVKFANDFGSSSGTISLRVEHIKR